MSKIQTPDFSVTDSEGETIGCLCLLKSTPSARSSLLASECVTPLFMIEPFSWSAEDDLEAVSIPPTPCHQGWWWWEWMEDWNWSCLLCSTRQSPVSGFPGILAQVFPWNQTRIQQSSNSQIHKNIIKFRYFY